MRAEDALAVARYHQEGIPTGFLSRLSVRFLSRLYLSIALSRDGFVLVAVDPEGRVVGFISGATNTKKMYRQILLKRGWLLAGLLLRQIFSLRMLKRLRDTILYPYREQAQCPDAELLSIVVDQGCRGGGVAGALLEALRGEFQRRNCAAFRVLVGANLARANAFYRKHGFRLISETESHGTPSNIYVLETGLSPAEADR